MNTKHNYDVKLGYKSKLYITETLHVQYTVSAIDAKQAVEMGKANLAKCYGVNTRTIKLVDVVKTK